MARFDRKRLGKHAAGVPADLKIAQITGSTTAAVLLPGVNTHKRAGLVAAIRATGGSAYTSITSTASIVAGGSLVPGVNVLTDPILVFWYEFD